MPFDIARAFARKQEVESARLDEYWFRHRARTVALLADALLGMTTRPLDRSAWAAAIASRPEQEIVEDLRAMLVEPIPDDAWNTMVAAAAAEARAQLVAEYGSPDPHRLV